MSKYRIGKRLKLIRVTNKNCIWAVGETGTVHSHDQRAPDGGFFPLVVRMDVRKNGTNLAYGVDEYWVPLNKPPLRERIRLHLRNLDNNHKPGSWDGTGFDPKKLTEKEKEHVTENSQ